MLFFFFPSSLEVETTASKYAECMGMGGGIQISSLTWTLQPDSYKLFKSFLDRTAPSLITLHSEYPSMLHADLKVSSIPSTWCAVFFAESLSIVLLLPPHGL